MREAELFFEEMRRLTNALAKQRCELWAVSSTNEWVIREGIKDSASPQQCFGRDGRVHEGHSQRETDAYAKRRRKSCGHSRGHGTTGRCGFRNSIHDAAMLRLAKKAYAVNRILTWNRWRRKMDGQSIGQRPHGKLRLSRQLASAVRAPPQRDGWRGQSLREAAQPFNKNRA